MTWRHINFQGQHYDLSHLKDFHFEVVRPQSDDEKGWSIPIHVSFSWHCYTRTPHTGETLPILSDGREERCFCPERFEHSKRLPDIIKGLSERRVFQTGKGNYLTIEIMDSNGTVFDYEIYFRVRKQGKKQPLRLFVESAYLRVPLAKSIQQKRKRQPVRFRVIVYNTHHGKHVRYSK